MTASHARDNFTEEEKHKIALWVEEHCGSEGEMPNWDVTPIHANSAGDTVYKVTREYTIELTEEDIRCALGE